MRVVLSVLVLLSVSACATLGQMRGLVQPPVFDHVPDQPAEIRLEPPSAALPVGGATVRVWTRVTNPNPFGLRLTTLDGTLFLADQRAAAAAFPLGLPLAAGEQAVVPLDVALRFADVPALADVVRRATRREPVEYRFDGTIGVDAGRLGQPVFGPMTLMSGNVQVR